MNTAWRCGICQKDFPPDKNGWLAIRDHAEDEHDATPKEACLGVVDVDTGEILQPGWSPTVLQAARKRGYVADKDGEFRVDPKFQKQDDDGIGEVIPIDSAVAKKNRISRMPTSSLTVVAKNVVVDETVQLLFIQAQAFFDYHNNPQDFSRFITDCCVIAASELGLDGAVMFADLVEKTVGTMMQDADTEGAED